MKSSETILQKDGKVIYYPSFFSEEEANFMFSELCGNTPWQQDTIKVFGKTYLQPRLTAFYSENNKSYSYSNIKMEPLEFTPLLQKIKTKIATVIESPLNCCLLNLYRNGNDSNGWHADNEKALGVNPQIVSVSFGAERVFHLKHKKLPLKHQLILEAGSVLCMLNETQHHWLHQLPKTKKKVGKRINLTFRYIK